MLVLRDRDICASSSNNNSDNGKDNYSNDAWDRPRCNQRRHATTHSTSTQNRQTTVSSHDFGDNDSNKYSGDSGREDDIPGLMKRYAEDEESREEPDR